MAEVIKKGNQHCVAHSTTGAVLKRKGRSVCFSTRAQAVTEANRTQCRILGGPVCKLVK